MNCVPERGEWVEWEGRFRNEKLNAMRDKNWESSKAPLGIHYEVYFDCFALHNTLSLSLSLSLAS